MHSDDTAAWVTEARRLFPELLGAIESDPARRKSLDDVLNFFPADTQKIAFLRFAHQAQIGPDDPAIHTIVQFLGVLLFLNENRIEPSTSHLEESVTKVREVVRSASDDMRKYTRLLVREAEKTSDGAKSLATAVDEAKALVGTIGTTIDDATIQRMEILLNKWLESVDARTAATIRELAGNVIAEQIKTQGDVVLAAMTEAANRAQQLSATTVQIRDALKPAVDAVNDLSKTVPILDRFVKIPLRDARIGATWGLIALAIGLTAGYELHQPQPSFTVTRDVLQAMIDGGYMMAVKDKLDPATRKKIDDAIAHSVQP
jgi:hypothetical protein